MALRSAAAAQLLSESILSVPLRVEMEPRSGGRRASAKVEE